jgi:hypothetical protein
MQRTICSRAFDSSRLLSLVVVAQQLGPFNPPSGPGPLPPPKRQPKRPGPAKSPWPFVIMAIVGPPTSIVAFVVMQLAFGAANSAGSGTLWFQIVGFALFLVWLASIVATIVGIIGAVVRSVRQH